MKRLIQTLLVLLLATSVHAADTKISALPDGSPAVATDRIPIARGAANFYIPFSAAWTVPSGSQFIGPTGCTTPAYSFTGSLAAGLCIDTGTVIVQSAASGNSRSFSNVGSTSHSMYFVDASGNLMQFVIEDNQATLLNESGLGLTINATAALFGLPIRTGNGSAAAPAYSFSGATASGFYHVGSHQVGLVQNGSVSWLNAIGDFRFRFDRAITWSSGSPEVSAGDTGFARSAAGVVKITDGSTGDGRLLLGNSTSTAVTGTSVRSPGVGLYMAGNTLGFVDSNSEGYFISSAAVTQLSSAAQLKWGAGTAFAGSPDTGLAREAAAQVKITDGTTGFGRLLLADGIAATNCAITFQNGGCIVSSGTPAITIGTATVGFAQFQSTVLRIASGAQFQWSSGAIHAAGADTGFARVAAAQIRASDGAAGIGAFQYASTVTAVTGTGQALVNIDSGKWFTNTGDSDGSSFNLPDDPGVRGLRYGFCVTTAQTVTINAGSGETIVDDGTSGTSIASSDDGACMELMAVINGSGGRWQVLSKTGTWTIS